MEKIFSVLLGQTHIGKVTMRRQGLYYHFHCRCRLPENKIYRLLVTCNTIQTNLGIFVPQENSFILDTKVPVKRIGEGELLFTAIPKQDFQGRTFVPISPEEPFAYLSRLKRSFLIQVDGQSGIYIPKTQGHSTCS